MSSQADSEAERGQDGGDADARPDRSPEENRSDGTTESPPTPECPPAESGYSSDAGGAGAAEVDDYPGEGGGEEGEGDPRPTGASVPTSGKQPRVSDREFELALKASNGNIHLTAKVLGLDRSTVTKRIKRNKHLYALYGAQAEGKAVPVVSTEEVMLRSADDIPVALNNENLGRMVLETEKIIRQRQLESGVPESTLKKLRSFDALNLGAGAIISQSLKDTHAILYDQLMSLDARADDIKTRYLNHDATVKVDEMTRMFWQRAHSEIIKEIRQGYETLMSGTQAMAALIRGKSNGNPTGAQKAKPAWGPRKSGA